MRAAAALGPKQAMPAPRTASATPATSGTSGPITTRSAVQRWASAATARRVGDVDAVLLGDRGRARVARRARQRGDAGVLRERENDRMLTSTGTDHEDAHDGTS